MSDIIASARSMTTVADGQYVAIGVPKGGLTPATITAMVGMAQGGGAAIDIAPKVNEAMTKLQTVASSSDYPANVNAQNALNSLTSIQSKLFNKDDVGGFGSIVGTIQSHINDSNDLTNATNFLKNSSYSDFGSGIEDMSSMGDRGLTNTFGSLSGVGSVMASTGSMFNGIDAGNFGKPGGLVESLRNNKLANAVGLNRKLIDAGVNLNDIHNPIYSNKISKVLSSIKDPAAINASADQFGITNPFGGLPSYSGSDSSLYTSPTFLGGTATTSAPAAGGATTVGTSTTSTAIGAGIAPSSTLPRGAGGIQSLKDLGDYTKLVDPKTAGSITGGTDAIADKLKDMGGGKILDASKASSLFGSIQKVDTPLINAAHPTLGELMNDHSSTITNLIGGSSVPSPRDFLGPIAGSPELDALAEGVTDAKVTALNASMAKTNTLLTAAGITTVTAPATQTLSGCMSFATKLHTYGKDQSEGSMGQMLKNMANSSTKYGEAVKASLAEGRNNDLLLANGIGPLKTNPFEGVPAYAGTDSSLATNAGAKLLGG